jgi:hypothetical protein
MVRFVLRWQVKEFTMNMSRECAMLRKRRTLEDARVLPYTTSGRLWRWLRRVARGRREAGLWVMSADGKLTRA